MDGRQADTYPHETVQKVIREGKAWISVYSVQKNKENSKAENKNEFTAVEEQIISLPAGSGPRHICFDDSYSHGFVINELRGSITIIKHSAEKSRSITVFR